MIPRISPRVALYREGGAYALLPLFAGLYTWGPSDAAIGAPPASRSRSRCRHFNSHVMSWPVVTTVSVFMQITAAFSVSGLRSTTLLLWHVSSDTRVTQPQQQIQQHHRDDSRTPWKNKIIFQESLSVFTHCSAILQSKGEYPTMQSSM